MLAMVEPNEVHWFSNEGGEDFSFVEFWVPPPTKTVWVKADDI
jgi:mannose-6-phosphate isomerase-like protein (cupin superfamily)